MNERAWATRRPPAIDGLRSQEHALKRAVRRLDLPSAARDVLLVLCKCADGAGFCWPSIAYICQNTGYSRPTVFRALAVLVSGDEPLVCRWPLLRDPARYRADLPYRARQGQGPSIYRVGVLLRRRAGLIEVDEIEHLGLVSGVSRSPISGVSLRRPTDIPEISPKPLQSRGSHDSEHETPRTENEKNLSYDPVGTTTTEVDAAHAREVRDDEPTLDEALNDPALHVEFVAPFAEVHPPIEPIEPIERAVAGS